MTSIGCCCCESRKFAVGDKVIYRRQDEAGVDTASKGQQPGIALTDKASNMNDALPFFLMEWKQDNSEQNVVSDLYVLATRVAANSTDLCMHVCTCARVICMCMCAGRSFKMAMLARSSRFRNTSDADVHFPYEDPEHFGQFVLPSVMVAGHSFFLAALVSITTFNGGGANKRECTCSLHDTGFHHHTLLTM